MDRIDEMQRNLKIQTKSVLAVKNVHEIKPEHIREQRALEEMRFKIKFIFSLRHIL
jgi:hypothetical protein